MVMCQISANICHLFYQLFETMFHPMSAICIELVLSNCLTYFTSVSSVFSCCSTYCKICYQVVISSSIYEFQRFLFVKRSPLFKSALSGAGSDQLPSWDDFVTAICLQFITVLFFFNNSLFLEMAVQDEQSIQNNDHICSEQIQWISSFQHWFGTIVQPISAFCRWFQSIFGLLWPISLFFHWISAVFFNLLLPWVVISCSIYFISFSIDFYQFPRFLGRISKGVLCSKVYFRGLDLTSYPRGMIL